MKSDCSVFVADCMQLIIAPQWVTNPLFSDLGLVLHGHSSDMAKAIKLGLTMFSQGVKTFIFFSLLSVHFLLGQTKSQQCHSMRKFRLSATWSCTTFSWKQCKVTKFWTIFHKYSGNEASLLSLFYNLVYGVMTNFMLTGRFHLLSCMYYGNE